MYPNKKHVTAHPDSSDLISTLFSIFSFDFESTVDPDLMKPANPDQQCVHPHNILIFMMKQHQWIDWKPEVHIVLTILNPLPIETPTGLDKQKFAALNCKYFLTHNF